MYRTFTPKDDALARNPPRTNKEGVWFFEWLRVANFGRRTPMRFDDAYRAWQGGEDPTQYAVT